MEEKIGFVYVLTNTSMPGIVKIGLTKNIKNRITNLSSRTAVPTPFKLYRAIKVRNMFEVENQFKEYFHEKRTNPQRQKDDGLIIMIIIPPILKTLFQLCIFIYKHIRK